MSEVLEFDSLELIEIEVKVGPKTYILREASGDVAAKWNNKKLSCTQFNDQGKPVSVKGLGDVEAYLVSLCLFDGRGDSAENVPLETIKKWKAKIVTALYEKAKDISELNDKAEEKAKIEEQVGNE